MLTEIYIDGNIIHIYIHTYTCIIDRYIDKFFFQSTKILAKQFIPKFERQTHIMRVNPYKLA